MDRNPYASPNIAPNAGGGARMLQTVPVASIPADPAPAVIDVIEQAGNPPRAWRLALGAKAWLYLPAEATAFEISHADLEEHGNIMPWSRFVAVVLRGLLPDGRAIAFKIEGERIGIFRKWLLEERDLHVGAALKKRLRFSLPLGVFVAFTALPILGPAFDPFAAVFGAGLAVLAVVGPRRPRPFLFAVEAFLWFSLTASHIVTVIDGSKWSIMFALLCFWIGRQSLRKFSFYR